MGIKIFVLFFLFSVSVLFSLHSGSADITWIHLFDFLGGIKIPEGESFLLRTLRVPRTEASLLIGACLGSAGLVLQTILRNPLAEPYTLGLSGGSSLGAVIALGLALEPNTFWVPVLSTIGCLLAVFLVLGLGSRRLEYESRSLILFGVMISLFFGALVVSGLSILSPDKLQSALFWLLGEFGTSRDLWIHQIGIFLLGGLGLLAFKIDTLDILSLGETRSLSLGISPKNERTFFLLLCTLLTALSVSIAGLVGFIGLVSPHLARRLLKTSRHRFLFVGSLLIGATLLSVADSLARILTKTGEIPAGSIAALLGAPVLIFLLTERKHAPAD